MRFTQPPTAPTRGSEAAASRSGITSNRRAPVTCHHGNQRSRADVRLVPTSHRRRPTGPCVTSQGPKGDSHVECELAAQNA